jgi:branched-chain amino acid transport system permease protein
MRLASAKPLAGIIASAAAASLLVAGVLPSYWVFLCTTAVIAAVSLQSVGVVSGRTGMISLCQMSFAGIGAWTVAWLNVHDAPGSLPLWILVGGLAAVPFGLAIGLPALRLRGINLAVVTLGFAAAFDNVLAATTFPGQTEFKFVPRPAFFDSDERYFVFCVIVFALITIGLELLSQTRLGAGWLAIRHSERATAAHGMSVPGGKLSAFALSAFIAGVSGGLLAGQLGTLVSDSFNLMQSLALFVLGTMVGARHAEGAVFGGLLTAFFPEILRRLDLPQDLGNIAFAIGAVQALSMGESTSEAWRAALRRARLRRRSAAQPTPPAMPACPPKATPRAVLRVRSDGPPALEVRDLTVRYGRLVALDRVSLRLEAGTVAGLIGPNGAGKSTLIDAVTGFVGHYDGAVLLEKEPLDGMAAHRRARLGVRRTWQQTRIAPDLTVGGYVRLAAGRRLPSGEAAAILDWLGCPDPEEPVAVVDVGTRRLLDIAGVIAARPRAIFLDEPAAGQSHEESVRLAARIAEIPDRFGAAVVLVEHDIDLVRMACSTVTVLDFGQVIASGTPESVLADPAVIAAYLGAAEEQAAS